MCLECGCVDDVGEKEIVVNRNVNEVNDHLAHSIKHLLKDKGILCINLMGSPGSGKTTFIEGLCEAVDADEIAVIQGDLESDVDKVRLGKRGIECYQINTHSGCHLNASMINTALIDLDLKGKKFLIIENVGNLVCPAGIDIGQHMDVVVSSTTEGSDKPRKYPVIFMNADLVLISKYDLRDAVEFDEVGYLKDIGSINGKVKILKVSCKDLGSFDEVALFLRHRREHLVGVEHSH